MGRRSARRLATVASTVANQQLANVSLIRLDGLHSLPFKAAVFDRVLVDAPCSGTGTLRQNPEIRWRLTERDIHRFAAQQVLLLQNASHVLKSGARMVYSTCSIEKEENEEVVAQFLERNAAFRKVPFERRTEFATSTGALRTWPHRDGADGFFVAAFEKRGG